MIGDLIYSITGGNIFLLLLATFLIFYFDSMFLTLLPEVFIIFFFADRPEEFPIAIWMIVLLVMATAGDVSGNYTVYLLFKKWNWFHNFVSDKLRKYVALLVLKDEKLILLNRVAPALPMCGVFMAACQWNIKRSLLYIFLGGVIKYSIILFFFGILSLHYPEETALWITLISVVAFLVISFFLGRYERKKLIKKAKDEAKIPKK